jgi:hypothetical protein
VLPDDFVVRLNDAVLDDIINKDRTLYAQRAKNAVRVEPAYLPDKQRNILYDGALQKLIENRALPEDATTERRRNAFAGTYVIVGLNDTVEISDHNGQLTYSYMGNTEPLIEVEPGLYFSPYGDAVDFRGRVPTFSNIRLAKVDIQTRLLQTGFYAICGLVFLSTLLYWPVRILIRKIRRKSAPVNTAAVCPLRDTRLVWTGILSTLASVFSLLLMVIIVNIPNSIYVLTYIPFLRPYVDLLWWQYVLLSLPFISLLFAIVIAGMAGLGMRSQTEARAIRFYYLTVALALLGFNLALII